MNEVLKNWSQKIITKICKSLYEIQKRHLLSARFLNCILLIFLIKSKGYKIRKKETNYLIRIQTKKIKHKKHVYNSFISPLMNFNLS